MRTIAIGDIHGCSRALDGLIEEIKPTEQDRLVFLGDYVDRGPDSRGVIERLLDLRKRCVTICLLGNHEIIFRSVLGGFPAETWLAIGGQETLASYGGKLQQVPTTHLEFMYSLLPYFETDRDVFLHANYDASLPLSEQTEQMLFWEHLGAKFPAPHCSGKHVFLGHTPQANFEVGYFGHLTCIDTCCFGGGWLTAVEADSGEVWQVSQKGEPRRNWGIWKQLLRKFEALRRHPPPRANKQPLPLPK
jgi:serine/threonine protein phosphatase 1